MPAAAPSRGHSTLAYGLQVVLQPKQLHQLTYLRRRKLRWTQETGRVTHGPEGGVVPDGGEPV